MLNLVSSSSVTFVTLPQQCPHRAFAVVGVAVRAVAVRPDEPVIRNTLTVHSARPDGGNVTAKRTGRNMAPPSDPPDAGSPQNPGLPHVDQVQCPACSAARRYQSLIEAGSSVIVCLSPDHRIVEFNHAAEQLYGRPRAAVLGKNYLELFLPEARHEAVAGDIERVLAGYPTCSFESTVQTPDGGERVLLWSVSRVLDDAGVPNEIIAVGRDVTKRKQAEEALRRYEHIVRASSDFIAFVDGDHVYRAVNATYLEAFGRTREAVVGRKINTLPVDEVFEARVEASLDRCLAGQRVHYELWLDCPRWGRRCLDVHLNPFRDVDGPVSGVVVVGRDITKRQRANEALLRHKQQLRTLASELALAGQRERRRVALGLHDQVGQALAMAKLKLGTALDSELSVNARRALNQSLAFLNQSIQATRSLTFQLSSAVLQELGLVAALEQLVEWFDNQSNDTRFVFASRIGAQTVGEDQDLLLYDMVRELLFNATKYAQASTVSLSVEPVADRLHIFVEDDGVGFDTASLHNGPSVDGGFGYFSIRERLVCLGGQLDVESTLGHGTQVVISIPLENSGIAVAGG